MTTRKKKNGFWYSEKRGKAGLFETYEKAHASKKVSIVLTGAGIVLSVIFFLLMVIVLVVQIALPKLFMMTAVAALLLGIGSVVLVMMKAVAILHKTHSAPLYKLVYDIRKTNDKLAEFDVIAVEDTDDEYAIINSVYFTVANQLLEREEDMQKLLGLTEKFENSANFDVLTGIYNRRRFMELVQPNEVLAAKKNENTFVVMVDLDHFKLVNDTYGHSAGDEVLKVIATRIKDTVRPNDLFGRYGGEEFIMFISVKDAESAISFVERIRAVVEEAPVRYDTKNIPITASFGVAQAAPYCSFEEAREFSDQALYDAKRKGRNRVELYNPNGGDGGESGESQ